MRWGFLLLGGIQFTSAQVPDSLVWTRYFPLEVGNQWQYRATELGVTDRYDRWNVRGVTIIGDSSYFELDVTVYDGAKMPINAFTSRIRYDYEHANVVSYETFPDGSKGDNWFSKLPCNLDAPFDSVNECTGIATGMGYGIGGIPNAQVIVGDDTTRQSVLKVFSSLGIEFYVASDIGLITTVFDPGDSIMELEFARVGDSLYGSPIVPTLIESTPNTPRQFPIITVYPNPASGKTFLTYTLTGTAPVTITLYNVLGQAVRETLDSPQGIGEYTEEFDVADLPNGLYFYRISIGRLTATKSLTVIH